MVEKKGWLTRIYDELVIRMAIRGSRLVLVLTPSERSYLGLISSRDDVMVFPNATSIPALTFHQEEDSVAVLFLARLHPRKGAVQFANVAARILRTQVDLDVTFEIAGPDEGDLAAVKQAVEQAADPRIRYLGPLTASEALAKLASADVYVLPAVSEPFGMTVIEALAGGAAVVLHRSAALTPELLNASAGVSFDGSDADLMSVVTSLIDDRALRTAIGGRGRELAARRYGIASSVDHLERLYAQ
jgi:glycosyltransferase involved in cell wall biosynthesis